MTGTADRMVMAKGNRLFKYSLGTVEAKQKIT